MEAKITFQEVDRKHALNWMIQKVDLEPTKDYNDLKLYLGDLMEYLHPQMDMFLNGKGQGIHFCWSVQVMENPRLMKVVEDDHEEHWSAILDDEDDDDDEMDNPVVLHTGNLQVPDQHHMAENMEEEKEMLLQGNSGSIRGKSNVVIE